MEGEPELDPESESDFCVSKEEEQNDDVVEIGSLFNIMYVPVHTPNNFYLHTNCTHACNITKGSCLIIVFTVAENLSSRSSLALRFLLVSP